MDIDHRRLDIGVAHERLHVMEGPDLNRHGPERMAEVMEPEPLAAWERLAVDPGQFHRTVERSPQGHLRNHRPDLVAENNVIGSGEPFASRENVECPRGLVD